MIKFYKTLSFTIPAAALDNQSVELTPDNGKYFGLLAPEFLVQDVVDLAKGIGPESNAVLESYRISFPGAVGLRPGSEAMANGENQIICLLQGRQPGQFPLFWVDQELTRLNLEMYRDPILTNAEHAPFLAYNPPTNNIFLSLDTRNLQPLYLGQNATCLIELNFTNRIQA
jgi:hypothetical protein